MKETITMTSREQQRARVVTRLLPGDSTPPEVTGNPWDDRGVPGRMSNRSLSTAVLIPVALAVVACTAGTGQTAPPSPDITSAPSATQVGIVHPTGAGEIVLRFDESGGFVPVEFAVSHVPQFTLYGDGTVVFVSTGTPTEPASDGSWTGSPLRTAHLTEAQVQDLLEFALGDGGLALAKDEYNNPLVADAPTAVFELHADGGDKTVSVVALAMDSEPGPDAAIRAALTGLGERLRDFDRGGTLASDPYLALGYRAVLLEAAGVEGVKVRPWPWPELGIDDFAGPADPNALAQWTRVLTPDEAAAVGIGDWQNGIQSGAYLKGPDDATYSFVLRPLLPGEPA